MRAKIPTRLINPQVLLWAMLRAEITPQELMRKTKIKNFSSLLQGNGYIFQKLSGIFQRSFILSFSIPLQVFTMESFFMFL